MPPTTDEAKAVRREAVGDALTELIASADITYYWDNAGAESILLTAALCCEMLAARSGGTEVAIASLGDGVSINRSVMPAELRRRALELRRRYAFGDTAAGGGAFSSVAAAVWADHPDTFTSDSDEFSA